MTIIAAEVERFNRLGATWWNAAGPMRPLHVINGMRVDYVCEQVIAHFAPTGRSTIEGLRILDVGCGGGLLCEPLARRGAQVTGIDAAAENVAAAFIHAASRRIAIDYRIGDAAAALGRGERFDVVLMLEVIEHVPDFADFVGEVARHVAPGGMLIVSTIDRTWKSFVLAIVGAEYVFRVLPKGTHDWRRFVRPVELQAAANRAGLIIGDLRGMRYLPYVHSASWVRDTSVNYIATFTHGHLRQARLPPPLP